VTNLINNHMKNLLVVLVILGYQAFGQSDEIRKLSSFSELSASEGITVYMEKGSKEEARVEVSGADLDDVVTDVIGSTLKIEMRGNKNYRNPNVTVYVTYKSVDEIDASSAASVDFKSVIKEESLEIDVSSAARVRAEISVEELDVDISSSGDVELSGMATSQQVDLSSAGRYDGSDLVSEYADVEVSSAGNAKVNVTQKIRAEASSGGSIYYSGNPEKVYADSSSGGKVRRN
jgi:hypothetical protein